MKISTIRRIIAVLFFLLACGCAIQLSEEERRERERAKKSLEEAGIPFTEAAFIRYSSKGDIDVMKLFLKAGLDVNAYYNETPLTAASRSGKVESVKFLLDNGAEINQDSSWETPLGVASYNGFNDVALLLLKSGADPNKVAKDGMTPLINAIYTSKTDTVDLLLNNGANPNYKLSDTGETPIITAARYGNKTIVELLIEAGANIQAKDFGLMTALDWAVIRKNWDIVKTLVDNKAYVSNDNKASRAIIGALIYQRFDIADLLVEKGENLNSLAYNRMPLIVWCAKNNNYQSVEYLVFKGVDITKRDKSGQSAMDYALTNKDQKMIEMLKNALSKQGKVQNSDASQ